MWAAKTGDGAFWERVSRKGDSECWLWLGHKTAGGYGTFCGEYVHRRSARMAGLNAEGKLVCHTCDVRACVNPTHLFIGDPIDNIHDMHKKGRHPHGLRYPNAKLTDEQVAEIRAAKGLQREIAARFGITQSHVSLIKSGHHRRYVK